MLLNSYCVDKKIIVAKLALEYTAKVTRERTGIALSNIYRWVKGLQRLITVKNKNTVRKMHLGASTGLSEREELDLKDWIVKRGEFSCT